ncbi:hypothetical protein GCM10011611_02100 [Aliidongia dinghuensis]|uniref:DUF4167 domain-containing protein n=1 Tax=Aliidongia dinghuensis TaxID=1867774 RepID=A0A8J3E0A7_9PROT|nr:DUF4167 domain-containing protein [Aliidongia dinghuensis]GGF00109.1 hypothetical protein GCM10011611_02100 [Aliidongia dinghuensis]
MRSGPNKRSRGRGNNNPNNMNGGSNNNGGGRPRPPHRSQTFDSNGPGMKIRGNAYQVFERYVALAREAASAGDRIAAENLYQHAEHYFRVMNANGEGPQHFRQQPQNDIAEADQPETMEASVQHAQPHQGGDSDRGHDQHEAEPEAQPAE